jgi:hypothetical protein
MASCVVVTIGGGSIKATKDRIISVVLVTGTTVVEAKTRNSGGVGCPISSLKVAPKLRETGVSITSKESD